MSLCMYSESSAEGYAGKYFKLTKDIDMNYGAYTFDGIPYFSSHFDGDNHIITNYGSKGLFGNLYACAYMTIKNLTIEYTDCSLDTTGDYWQFGGLACNSASGKDSWIVEITNVHTKSIETTKVEIKLSSSIYAGGLFGHAYTNGFSLKVSKCSSSLNIHVVQETSANKYAYLGGLYGGMNSVLLSNNICEESMYSGNLSYYIKGSSSSTTTLKCGGLVGYLVDTPSLKHCLFIGTISGTVVNGNNNVTRYIDALVGDDYTTGRGSGLITYNYIIGACKVDDTPNYVIGYASGKAKETTADTMRLRSTYSSWTDFNDYWTIQSNINNGFPMLKCFLSTAKVTGFDGSGTENDPYLIKTHQDLLGMAGFYNDYDVIDNDIYWKVVNNIDMSVDANNMLIHFTPICYAKEFDGYFDGNGKTISGLLIDNQYEYTGLFGTIGANHWVKNLTVKGNIYWDEAYAVGGVAGRVLDGGYLQDCAFEGNIIGVLNTKPSTETNGVVGKYEINGAVDCSATYTDLKYAKIGGTADNPTYTYYLYDWAQIKTYLYDRKVS